MMKKQINRRKILLFAPFFLITSKFGFASEIKLPIQKIGSDKAKIVVKEFFSLTCGHCADFHIKTFPSIKREMIDEGLIQFEFVDYPLDRVAMYAAALTRSLPKESYIEAINILLKNQKKWAFSSKPMIELLSIAKIFGITKNSFDKIMKNYDLMQKVLDKMEEDSKRHDIQSTPTFIINNKYKISGTVSFESFKKKLNKFIPTKNLNG